MDVFSTSNLGGYLIAAAVLSGLLFTGVAVGASLTLPSMADKSLSLERIGAIVCLVAGLVGLIAVTGLIVTAVNKWRPVGDLLFDLYRAEGVAYPVPKKPAPIVIEQKTPKDVRRNVNVNVDKIDDLRRRLARK